MTRKNNYSTKHVTGAAFDKYGRPKALCGLPEFEGLNVAAFLAQPKEHRCIKCEAKAAAEAKEVFKAYAWLGV